MNTDWRWRYPCHPRNPWLNPSLALRAPYFPSTEKARSRPEALALKAP
jgi:hypothetical protein